LALDTPLASGRVEIRREDGRWKLRATPSK
jgi:hypothetical protein